MPINDILNHLLTISLLLLRTSSDRHPLIVVFGYKLADCNKEGGVNAAANAARGVNAAANVSSLRWGIEAYRR